MFKAALLGAGSRGTFAYATYALQRPDEVQFIAVAEPHEGRRKRFAELHNIPQDRQFASWQELLAQPRLCEALLICTQDRDHYEPTMKALQAGYHILLEKPMSPNPWETMRMAEEAERQQRILSVCHVSRYSPFFSTVKKLLDEGKIGKLITIQWNENVGYWHQAHSFVRGNWRNSTESSPMLLQKCCHDMDMLQWLIGGQLTSVSSFGALTYFKESNAPQGSTLRCTDGCSVEHECVFSALKLYLNEIDEWPQNVVTMEPDHNARLKALQEGPYGRCVYHCDNDVVDHQVANLLFDNEVTVAFTMSAFTREINRTFKIMGTEGELRGHSEKNELEIRHFSGQTETVIPEEVEGGHNGADTMTMRNFVRLVEHKQIAEGVAAGKEAAKSHLIVFAAEESRKTGQTVSLSDYIHKLKQESLRMGEVE